MKKTILLILVFTFSINLFSQTTYEKGYIKSNTGSKTECLIKNEDWKNNPINFQYKISENEEVKTATIAAISEFGVYGGATYQRHVVKIDRSSEDLDDLDTKRRPKFNEEQLFLEVLVDGKADLYSYQDGNLTRYFYQTGNSGVMQLVYKQFKYTKKGVANKIGKNTRFKQQLYNSLECEGISMEDIERVEYKKRDLIPLFVKYNKCVNSDFTKVERQKMLFNLSIRPGVSFVAPFEIINSAFAGRNVEVKGSTQIFRIGVEAEIILPFNNNKWSIIFEPTYRSYQAEKNYDSPFTTSKDRIEVDYTSIELPLGLRHYFYIDKNTRIFLNAAAFFEKTLDSKISYISSNGTEIDISTGLNFVFGGGVKYKNYSLEFRYETRRNILGGYEYYNAKYSNISLIFGYTLF